ncbi:MAG TPA: His/Gly/Thr/Pro-type tRNA ligase C-terminal domain-containing protein, partial [Gammaproteobacteria bacterium]|nr:His/Gly/Thr/Pro-type tRNA ligase C-terminal domain-containing protein [Gammaproteobacteria bacterium]
FVAFLVELYGGALPTWLAPVQLYVVPVSDAQRGYAERIVQRLRAKLVRASAAPSGVTVARAVRDAAERKIPNVAVVGQREEANGSASLRRHGNERQEVFGVDELERRLLGAIARRARTL